MYDQGVIKRYVNATRSCKLCVKNENFENNRPMHVIFEKELLPWHP